MRRLTGSGSKAYHSLEHNLHRNCADNEPHNVPPCLVLLRGVGLGLFNQGLGGGGERIQKNLGGEAP